MTMGSEVLRSPFAVCAWRRTLKTDITVFGERSISLKQVKMVPGAIFAYVKAVTFR